MSINLTMICRGAAALIVVLAFVSITIVQPASATAPCVDKTFKIGSQSTCVGAIQMMLNALDNGGSYDGTQLGVDGKYGAKTAGQVTRAQKWYNSNSNHEPIKADGVVGPPDLGCSMYLYLSRGRFNSSHE